MLPYISTIFLLAQTVSMFGDGRYHHFPFVPRIVHGFTPPSTIELRFGRIVPFPPASISSFFSSNGAMVFERNSNIGIRAQKTTTTTKMFTSFQPNNSCSTNIMGSIPTTTRMYGWRTAGCQQCEHPPTVTGTIGPLYHRTPRFPSLVRTTAKRRVYGDEDDGYGELYDNGGGSGSSSGKSKKRNGSKRRNDDVDNNNDEPSYDKRVHQILDTILQTASSSLTTTTNITSSSNTLRNERAQSPCGIHRDEFKRAIERVGEGLVERGVEARLVVLAAVAGEHVLFLGVPGTGKSILGRRLSRLCNGPFFQRLLTRFTTPEEIFGPLSLRSLEMDEYRRVTNGFLPTASVAFLDEIFKANSAILNTLLTILNERRFENGGGTSTECPIRCVVAASNELPESDELDALYDRFLLRKEVVPVSDEGLEVLLGMDDPGGSVCDDIDDDGTIDKDTNNVTGECDVLFSSSSDLGFDAVVSSVASSIRAVRIPPSIRTLLVDLRTYLRDELGTDVSDRRFVRAARLLKVVAATDGRDRVDLIDCLLLQHVVWSLPEQRASVRDWLWDRLGSVDNGYDDSEGGGGIRTTGETDRFRLLLSTLRTEIVTMLRKTSGDVTGTSGGRPADIAVLSALRAEVQRISSVLCTRREDLARHIELLSEDEGKERDSMTSGSSRQLWIDPDEAKAVRQSVLPRANKVMERLWRVSVEARGLELALNGEGESIGELLVMDDMRVSAIEGLWDDDDRGEGEMEFSEEELDLDMRDAKGRYDLETFRKWKRARKKFQKKR